MAGSRNTSFLIRVAVALMIIHAGREFGRAAHSEVVDLERVANGASADSTRPDSASASDSGASASERDTAAAASASASDSGGTPPATAAKPAAPKAAERKGNPALGKKIFSVKCVACHKADGSGGVKITGNPTPDWRDAKRMADPKHNDAYLRDCITNGRPKSGMPTWSKQGVKPGDIDNLIAYIRTFSEAKAKK
jgi:mono/diheme cytochrome c family protein